MEMETNPVIKCHKCRHILTDANVTNTVGCPAACTSYDIKQFIYLLEEKLPNWIKLKIEEEQWTKGKLHCVNCGSKVGSFDFVSGRKCECGTTVLPSVHFVTSQVDRPIFIKR